MIRRYNGPSILTLGVLCTALAAAACGQAPDSTGASQSVDEALRAIRSCQSADPACGPDAGGAKCDAMLKSCLMSALPDAGVPLPTNGMNGSAGGVADSGLGKPPTPAPTGVGGSPSSLRSPSPTQSDAGPERDGCIDALRTCLESTAPARSCASTAHTCLEAMRGSK